MKGILELIKLIYGSKALSKILGTRTNVIRLPDNELKQYTKSELNIEAASDKLAQKAKADMKELLADYPRMNDAEKLIFEGNLRRLGNKLGVTEKGPAADVLEFGTGEKVSPEGIMSLTEKAGQKSPPTTLMGKLESRVKQLEASGEDLSKMKGQTYDEFMDDITKGQRTMIKLEDEGLVRATAREIIDKDIKSKKIKLPKEVEADFKQGGGEPIDVFRQFYGEDALEQLNSMVPDFRQMYSSKEAAEAATKKFNFEFKADRPPGSISIEDAKKAEQEFNIIPADSEEGKVITEKLIGKPKAPVTELMTAEKIILDMKNMDPMDAMKEANKVLKKEGKYKNLKEEDVERIMEDTNDFIFGRDIPEDPEGFAKGGRVRMAGGGVSQGLDYLMGIERRGYQEGSSTLSREEIINRILQEIKPGFESAREVYPDYYSTGLDVDYLKTLDPDEIKQALDRAYLQGEGFQNADFSTGRIGRGVPFFRYSPEYMKKVNYTNPLQLSDSGTAYNLRNQLNELESILGKKNIEAYKTTLDDSLIDYYKNRFTADLDLQKKLFGEQTTPTVEEQMISPEDALTPPAPDVNPLQQHFDNDYLLKQAVASGEITPEQSNELGGYDVQQMLSPGNPLLGGIGNLIGSTVYNIAQSSLPANNLKDSFGNVIYEDTPFIIGEDANTIYSQTPRASQPLREIPGDVYRNVKGGLGLISPELKQTYRNIIQQRAPANIVENINTAVSSLNPFQQQRYMNYAVENPDRAIQAAQRDQDFRTSIQNRDQKQKGGLSYLLGM